ncbi:hypothetical protein VaNZ11_010534, partial [Volvox africanus]
IYQSFRGFGNGLLWIDIIDKYDQYGTAARANRLQCPLFTAACRLIKILNHVGVRAERFSVAEITLSGWRLFSWAMRKHNRDDTREVVRLKGDWTQRGFCGSTLTKSCKRSKRDSRLVSGEDGVAAQDGTLLSYSIPQIPPEGYILAACDDETSGVKFWLDTLQGGGLLGRQPSLRSSTPAKPEPCSWLRNQSSVHPRHPTAFRDAAMFATWNKANIAVPDPPDLSIADFRQANNDCRQAILQLDDSILPSIPAHDSPPLAEVRGESTPFAVARNSAYPEGAVMIEAVAAEKVRCHGGNLPKYAGGHQADSPGVSAQDGEVPQVPPGRRAPMSSPFAIMSTKVFYDDLKNDLALAKDSERPTRGPCPGDSRHWHGFVLTPTNSKVPCRVAVHRLRS